jgi:predicted metal-dependent phosphoesterase TrpH
VSRVLAFAVFVALSAWLWVSAPRRARTEPSAAAGGLRVVEGDFHLHTRFSDGVASPFDVVLLAERRGLDVIAITEHNTTFPAKLARVFAELRGSSVLVLVGEEVTSKEAHVLGLGIEETVDPRLPTVEVARAVHVQGGVVAAAHPVERYWPALEPACDSFDAIELMHPMAYRPPSKFGSWDQIRAFDAACPGKAALGNSDFHFGPDLGEPRTYLFVPADRPLTREVVLDAIRAGRTAVRLPDGSLHGPEELLPLVRPQPVEVRSSFRTILSLLALAAVGFFVSSRRACPSSSHPLPPKDAERS